VAKLSPDGRFLMQQVGGIVMLIDDIGLALGQFEALAGNDINVHRAIDAMPQLDSEQKAMAHFWAGYFYAHACLWER